MSKFSDLLAALGLAPKTLPQAKETIDGAKATLDSVAALFTAAGLNLEQMLAAGPESLKAHIDSVDNTEELAEALQENERLGAALTSAGARIENAGKAQAAYRECFKAIGISDENSALAADQVKTAFESHISKQTTLALAKTGHPPAHVPAAAAVDDLAPSKEAQSDAKVLEQYLGLIAAENAAEGDAKAKAHATRRDFGVKHNEAIQRANSKRLRAG